MLFLLGAIQSLLPYIHWSIFGPNQSYDYPITYFPGVMIFLGWLFFYFGTFLVSKRKIIKQLNIQIENVRFLTFLIAAILFAQLVLLVELYGGYPIAMYLGSDITVSEVNRLQENSFSGQLGVYTLTNFSLTALLFIEILYSIANKIKFTKYTYLIFFVLCISVTFAGKRQGILQIFEYILCGITLSFNKPVLALSNCFFDGKMIRYRYTVVLIIFILLLFLFSYMESLRIQSDSVNIYASFMSYLEWPLINFEYYCDNNNLVLIDFNLAALIGGFIPYKIAVGSDYLNWTVLSNNLPEKTAGLGFHGGNYANYGLLGMLLYSYLTGALSKYFYEKSKNSLFYKLAYAQISWTLLFSHTYNFINSAAYLWGPLIIYYLLIKYVTNHSKIKL